MGYSPWANNSIMLHTYRYDFEFDDKEQGTGQNKARRGPELVANLSKNPEGWNQ